MSYLDKHPTSPDLTSHNQDWFANRRKSELVETIIELRHRLPNDTLKINQEEVRGAQAANDHQLHANGQEDAFVRLPLHPSHWHRNLVGAPWRIELVSSNPTHPSLKLEIGGDVFIGRASSGIEPDLDLTEFDAMQLGVSRQHALLRPCADALCLIDLGSTNGTRIGQRDLEPGSLHILENGDTISLAELHLSLRTISEPERPPRKIE